jgi:hypothetical protein
MKLSSKDKPMVSMSWLIEIFLRGLTDNKDVPESKKEQYEKLQIKYQEAFDIVAAINKEFESEIDSVFGVDFKDDLVDVTTILSILYMTTPINKMLSYLRWVGQRYLLDKNSERLKKESKSKKEDD